MAAESLLPESALALVQEFKAEALERKSAAEITLELERRLTERYKAPAWAYLSQVRNGTGFRRLTTRTADGLAMSLYPSRGLHVHGFEIKASTADMKAELEHPDKAEDIARFCDFWWLVTVPSVWKAVVAWGSIPQNWGVLVADKNGLRIAKEAVQSPYTEKIDRLFLASILRRVSESTVPVSQVRREVEERLAAGLDQHLAQERRGAKYTQEKLDKLQRIVHDFEQASGLRINEYTNGQKLGEAVARIQGMENLEQRLARLRDQARLIAEAADQAVAGKETTAW